MKDSADPRKRGPSSVSASSRQTRRQDDEHREWLMDEALAESFPASDSPATSLCVPGGVSESRRA